MVASCIVLFVEYQFLLALFTIFFKVTPLTLGQLHDCPSVSGVTLFLKDIDEMDIDANALELYISH